MSVWGIGLCPVSPCIRKLVNRKDLDPMFTFLKEKLPLSSDDRMSSMTDPKFVWNPVCRNDIFWNFEVPHWPRRGTLQELQQKVPHN
ncbi:GPX1 peroxidase, partial [Polyodon spathula]|nr:GPX1 peroxidase [Polyodon spathula]